jgi:hypothetical protein
MTPEVPILINPTDHDLLISVATKMDIMINEMQKLRDDSGRRMESLENKKLDVSDFSEYKLGVRELSIELKKVFDEHTKEDLKYFKNAHDKIDNLGETLGDKIYNLNKYMWVAVGAMSMISYFLPIIINRLVN